MTTGRLAGVAWLNVRRQQRFVTAGISVPNDITAQNE